MFKGSWKTTLCAVMGLVIAAWTMIGGPILDADPATLPKYQEFLALASAAITGFFARDNDKSSEQVGAK